MTLKSKFFLNFPTSKWSIVNFKLFKSSKFIIYMIFLLISRSGNYNNVLLLKMTCRKLWHPCIFIMSQGNFSLSYEFLLVVFLFSLGFCLTHHVCFSLSFKLSLDIEFFLFPILVVKIKSSQCSCLCEIQINIFHLHS